MTANGLAGLNLPNDEVVVVLATEGSQVLLVLGEGEGLNVDLVQFETVNDLESVEVPNDNVRLKSETDKNSNLVRVFKFGFLPGHSLTWKPE